MPFWLQIVLLSIAGWLMGVLIMIELQVLGGDERDADCYKLAGCWLIVLILLLVYGPKGLWNKARWGKTEVNGKFWWIKKSDQEMQLTYGA